MSRGKMPKKTNQAGFDIDSALASMNAEELRELVRDLLGELDKRTQSRIINSLLDRAARNDTDWSPDGPAEESIAEILSFAKRATQKGYADPDEMDDYLREGSSAFLSRDYQGASQIFRALLLPISEVEIDLGQHEMVDEVLTVDVADCAAQYVVSMYMLSEPEQRVLAVKEAIDEVHYEGDFSEPLKEMERVSIEPLPELNRFLPKWRTLIEGQDTERRNDWDTDQDRWLREVVKRMEGTVGLAKIARTSKRFDDLRAWCQMLVEAGNWKAAFTAYKEAADIVMDKEYARGDFFDGVALAAQELGKKNLAEHLERAWRDSPNLLRLIRWLGTSKSKATTKKRAKQALKACPKKALRQKAFLNFILSDFAASGKLLGNAAGLGWSDSEHPGHLIFPLFYKQLGGNDTIFESGYRTISTRELSLDEMELMTSDRDEPSLKTPTIDEVLSLAGIVGDVDESSRKTMLGAMKKAAKKRVAGVTGKGRRKYYGHAAQLVAACVAVDTTSQTAKWMTGLRADYRRYPALQSEFVRLLGQA